MSNCHGEADKSILRIKKGQVSWKFQQQPGRSKRQIEMFLHTIGGSLFRQPMKYLIITCESVVVGIRDDTVQG